MGFFAKLFGNRVRTQIEACRVPVMQILCTFLFERYANQHPDWDVHKVAALAAAVTNGLFAMPPGNEKGQAFLEANTGEVQAALSALKNEPCICEIASIFVHMLANVAGNSGTLSPDTLALAMDLDKLGILVPVGQLALPRTPEELAEKGKEFQLWVIRQSGDKSQPA